MSRPKGSATLPDQRELALEICRVVIELERATRFEGLAYLRLTLANLANDARKVLGEDKTEVTE